MDKTIKPVPSILLRVVIPYEENGSFYYGHVYFSLRNSLFDVTNTITKMMLLIDLVRSDKPKIQSMLVYLSDDGDDHNVTHLYVQCGIILVCLLLKIYNAICFSTIPGYSWSNMVEIVILILNLALQGLSLARAPIKKLNEIIMKC